MNSKSTKNSLIYQDSGNRVTLILPEATQFEAWRRYGISSPSFLSNWKSINIKDFVKINGVNYPHGIITMYERSHYINAMGQNESYFCTFCRMFTPTPQCNDCKGTENVQDDYFCGLCKHHISPPIQLWEHYSSTHHYHNMALYNPSDEIRFFQEEYIEPKNKVHYYLCPSMAAANALCIRDEPPEDRLYIKIEYPALADRFYDTQLKAQRSFDNHAKQWSIAIATGDYTAVESQKSIMSRTWYIKSALNQHLFSLEQTPIIPCGGESALMRGLIKEYAAKYISESFHTENFNINDYGYHVSEIPCQTIRDRYTPYCPQKHFRLIYNNIEAVKAAIVDMVTKIGPLTF